MTELLVGTKKGLFVLRGDGPGVHDIVTRAFPGDVVEFAIRDGVPYAIDFMNSAPDFDISSLGPEHFRWTVEKMADLVLRLAKETPPPRAMNWRDVMR